MFISEGSGNWRCVNYTSAGGGNSPAGAMLAYGGSAAPSGWLLCYGQAVSRTTYAGLFAAISTAYGTGDGSTTFNVPDLRGRSPFGKDNMGGTAASRLTSGVSGVDGATLGASGGDQNAHHATIAVTDPGHNHTSVHISTGTGAGDGYVGGSTGSITETGTRPVNSNTTGITAADNNTGSSQNIPPALVVNYIIKT